MNRSFLFVPGDGEGKLKKAAGSSADALIIDLEDSVVSAKRPEARKIAKEFIVGHPDLDVWIRINALDTEDAVADLREVMPAGPAGIVLPKSQGAKDVIQLGKLLDVFEQENGLPQGHTLILPIATERPAALFGLQEYSNATSRLAGLTWGAEDLCSALGAMTSRGSDGNWLPPYELARSLCLFAASAAGVAAIDTVFTNFRDLDGLERYASNARRDGFSGMLAIHPAQVDGINDAFMPSHDEIDRARRIVELFAGNQDAGTLGMNGEMIDRPHLVQAKRILDIAQQDK